MNASWDKLKRDFAVGGVHAWSRLNFPRLHILHGDHVKNAGETHAPCIFMSNHVSLQDWFTTTRALAALGHTLPVTILGENLRHFPMKLIYESYPVEFMRRTLKDDPDYALRFADRIAVQLRASRSLLFYPEGTRSRTGELIEFKYGLLSIALDKWRNEFPKLPMKIVPISVGYDRLWEWSSPFRQLEHAIPNSPNSRERKRTETFLEHLSLLGRSSGDLGDAYVAFGRPITVEVDGGLRSVRGNRGEDLRRFARDLASSVRRDVESLTIVNSTAVVAVSLLDVLANSQTCLVPLSAVVGRYGELKQVLSHQARFRKFSWVLPVGQTPNETVEMTLKRMGCLRIEGGCFVRPGEALLSELRWHAKRLEHILADSSAFRGIVPSQIYK